MDGTPPEMGTCRMDKWTGTSRVGKVEKKLRDRGHMGGRVQSVPRMDGTQSEMERWTLVAWTDLF